PLPEAGQGEVLAVAGEDSGEADEIDLFERVSIPVDDSALRADEGGPASDLTPILDGDSGINDVAGILTHALLEEVEPDRCEVVRRRLVAQLKSRKDGTPTCIGEHLREAANAPAGKRDLARVRMLASVVEEAGLVNTGATPMWIPVEVVVAVFPSLFSTFIAGGGSAGLVCRGTGRSRVLSAAPALLADGGPLRGALLDRVLS